MKNITKIIIVALACLILGIYTPAFATVINIPEDYATIQAGVEASTQGDTILVQPDIYIENVSIIEHGVTLGSLFLTTGDTSFISTTIIDGDSLDTVVRIGIWSSDDITSTLTGFTIRNGNANYGGGGINIHGEPTISHNIICNNATTRGGGIFVSGSPIIENNLITENHVTVAGGGIVSYGGACVIRNNVIVNNASDHYGGGIHIEDSEMVAISGNTISNNTANNGGGINFHGEGMGGMVTYNLISGNTANMHSAMALSYANYFFTNNTIVDNSYNAEGIHFYSYCNSILTNNVIWNNADTEILVYPDGSVNITYCDIQGGWEEGEHNIDTDPLFCDPEIDDYSLAENSPCAGAGFQGADIGAYGIGCDATDMENELSGLPALFGLNQNYPNPFNAKTSIHFELNEPSHVKLEIYNLLGIRIKTLINSRIEAGTHTVNFDASGLSSGIYIYNLQSGDYSSTKRMVLLK